jgi:hypothetical protein
MPDVRLGWSSTALTAPKRHFWLSPNSGHRKVGPGSIAEGTALALSVAIFSGVSMLGIPRRFSHFVYGVIQSGLTCAIAAGIASFPFVATGTFVTHWLQSWFIAWIMMLPIVLFAAPAIRNLTHILTRED